MSRDEWEIRFAERIRKQSGAEPGPAHGIAKHFADAKSSRLTEDPDKPGFEWGIPEEEADHVMGF